jgi:hypothetical protein
MKVRGWIGLLVALIAVAAVAALLVFGRSANNISKPTQVVDSIIPAQATATQTVEIPTATPAILTPAPTPQPAPTFAPTATALPAPEPTPEEKDPVLLGLVGIPPDLGRTGGRWIDVNLGDGYTRLMEGRQILKEMPSAWGYGVTGTDSDYFSTPPDLYFVYEKRDELHHDETYSTGYFRGWVGFDPERANGFHSFILDAQEKIIDAQLGPVSHGCVRVEDWRALYDFAQVGMPVLIHQALPARAQGN